jgi:hypothetical protein
VNVTPPNQSLILASELAPRGGLDSPLGRAARPAASSTALQRVTILTARTVLVQADYFSRAETLIDPRAAIEHVPRLAGMPIPFVATSSSVATPSSRNPVQLYARTQRHGEDTSQAPLLDVFA